MIELAIITEMGEDYKNLFHFRKLLRFKFSNNKNISTKFELKNQRELNKELEQIQINFEIESENYLDQNLKMV